MPCYMTVCGGGGTRIGGANIGYGWARQLACLRRISQNWRSQYRRVPFLLRANKWLWCWCRRWDSDRGRALSRGWSSHGGLQSWCRRRRYWRWPINGAVRRRRRTFPACHHSGIRGWGLNVGGVFTARHILHPIVDIHYNVAILRLLIVSREKRVVLKRHHISCPRRRGPRSRGGSRCIASVWQVIWSSSPTDCCTLHSDAKHCNDENRDEKDDAYGATNNWIDCRLHKDGTNFRIWVFCHCIRRLEDWKRKWERSKRKKKKKMAIWINYKVCWTFHHRWKFHLRIEHSKTIYIYI